MSVNSFDTYPLTWKPDKKNLIPPYYKSLAEDLTYQIKAGLLKPGTKLPPQREIADYLELNYTTITRVYNLCKNKGLIYGIMGKGTFVAPHSSEEITVMLPTENRDCIEMAAVSGFSEYSELVEKATSTVVERGYLRNLYEYSFPTGHPHQIAAGVRWMEQMGTHTDHEHTAIFSGAQNALTIALISLFSPGDKIAVEKYTYTNFIEVAKLLHLVLVPIEADNQGMIPDHLLRQCMTNKIKGIYLIPTCANPTTITMPLTRRYELAEIIQKQNMILIEDDIVAWMLSAGGKVLPSLFDIMGGQSIYICGMTKSLCPGLRIAYMTYADKFREQILHGLINVNIKSSAFDAEIITELILNGDAYKITNQKYLQAEKNSLLYEKYFPTRNPYAEKISYYKWLPIQVKKEAKKIEEELLRAGVRIYHAQQFAAVKDNIKKCLRISLCSAGNIKKIEQGLEILKEYLEKNSR